jgi:hypothetical protein
VNELRALESDVLLDEISLLAKLKLVQASHNDIISTQLQMEQINELQQCLNERNYQGTLLTLSLPLAHAEGRNDAIISA